MCSSIDATAITLCFTHAHRDRVADQDLYANATGIVRDLKPKKSELVRSLVDQGVSLVPFPLFSACLVLCLTGPSD